MKAFCIICLCIVCFGYTTVKKARLVTNYCLLILSRVPAVLSVTVNVPLVTTCTSL